MTVYLRSDFAPSKKIKATRISYDVALHNFVVYGEDGTITVVDLSNTHFISTYKN